MKKSKARANHHMPFGSNVVSRTQPGIEILPLCVEHAGRPGFKLPADPPVQRKTARGTPLILNEEAIVRVVQCALGLITNGRREARALVHRRIQALFVEIRGLETLKENDVGMLAPGWPRTTGIPGSRDALRPDTTRRAVIAQKSAQTGEICLKRIEKREGLRRLHEIEIAAKTDGVLVKAARYIVHEFKARLAVKIWIAAVHTDRERIRQLQVRLRCHRREVKGAPRKLHAKFVDELGADHRNERSSKRLIAIKVILESRRKIETIVQWRLIEQSSVIDEVTHEKRLIVAEEMVQAKETVVRVVGAQNASKIRLRSKPVNRFHLVDRVDVCKYRGIVKR